MPDDERKGRRLGDETKGRIADLASGWTVERDAQPVAEPPIRRDASSPARPPLDAPRRKAKTLPPPPPGSAARKALEDRILELREAYGDDEDDGGRDEDEREDSPPPVPAPTPPARSQRARPSPSPPPSQGRATGPVPGRPRAGRTGDALDVAALAEADKTKENRGAVGVKHDRSASLTTNSASGTIEGETPPPIFDRAAIAAGPRRGLAGDRAGSPPGPRGTPQPGERTAARGNLAPSGTGQRSAASTVRGTPRLGASADRFGPGPASPPAARGPLGSRVDRSDDSLDEFLDQSLGHLERLDRLASADEASDDVRDDDDEDASEDAGDDRPAQRLGRPGEAGGRRNVPLGEFEPGQAPRDPDRLRSGQATIKRDAASALLGLAEPGRGAASFDEPTRRTYGEAEVHDTSRSPPDGFDRDGFDRDDPTRGDPTAGDLRDDATALSPAAAGPAAPTGRLRSAAALPRRRGAPGDVRYIATVVLGLRAARRELAALAAQQATRQQSRRHHLVTLGRAAVNTEGFDHPALGAAREQLADIEGEREAHAGHVVAADAELARVRREREAKAKQHAETVAALDTELAALGKQLDPLEKEAAAIKRRGADLYDAIRRLDARIAATEASLAAAKGGKAGKLDPATVQAELATLRADRKAIQSDEPGIAGQLDAVSPRIAALDAARTEARRKRAEIAAAEHDDQRRVEELLTAIGAKRKVVDRAAADAEALRDKILFQLGEQLYVDRPDDLSPELAPIDEIDLELGGADRRRMELREILASVDRWKLVRGIALVVVLLAAIGALAAGILWLRA